MENSAKFCPKCGSEVAAKTAAAKATKTVKVQPEAPAQVPVATPTEIIVEAQTTLARKQLPKKPLLIAAGVLGVAVAAYFGYSLLSHGASITASNAKDYLVTSSNTAFDSVEGDGFDMSGQVLSECSVESEITPLFEAGTTWATSSITSPENSSSSFHIDQRIFTAPAATLSKIESLFKVVGTDSSCDAIVDSPTGLNVKFLYQEAQTINDVFGVDVPGVVIEMSLNICDSSCSTTTNYLVLAYQGESAMLFDLGGGRDGSVAISDLRDEVAKALSGLK